MLARVALSLGSSLPKSGRLLYAATSPLQLANSIKEGADGSCIYSGFLAAAMAPVGALIAYEGRSLSSCRKILLCKSQPRVFLDRWSR